MKGSPMKPRLTLIVVLALGLLVGGTVATSAFAASAGSAQYAPEEEEEHFCTEEEGGSGSGSGSGGSESGCEHEEEREHVCEENESGNGSGSGSGSEESSSGENCEHPAPEPPQNLPYTGFPVVPALLVGLGLLGTGVAMRRRLGSGGGFA